jgi:hypothetical protein
MTKANENQSYFIERVRAGALGEICVFTFKGGRFGLGRGEVIYQDFGGARGWVECPNEQVREFAKARGII